MTKVYLAVGHGRKPNGVWDPGAVNADAELNEQTAGDIVVGEMERLLRDAGVAVRSEARDPDDPNWVGTAKRANAWGADYVVSVHHDWSGSRLGAHGFYYTSSSKGRPLGRAILLAVEAAGFDVSWSWFKDRPELGLLRTTDMPAFLLECGPIGAKALDEPDELRAIGAAAAQGIGKFIGVDIDDDPEPAPTPEPDPNTDNWTETIVENLPLLKRRDNLRTRSAPEARAQGLLAAAGYLDIQPNLDSEGRFDGKFGGSTEDAVEAFQRAKRLKVDGLIGKNTWTALLGG